MEGVGVRYNVITMAQQAGTARIVRELALLRSFVIGHVGRDTEGAYRPEFVRALLRAANERPRHTFRNPKQFLAQIQKNKG